jgi:hypothetical protein
MLPALPVSPLPRPLLLPLLLPPLPQQELSPGCRCGWGCLLPPPLLSARPTRAAWLEPAAGRAPHGARSAPWRGQAPRWGGRAAGGL